MSTSACANFALNTYSYTLMGSATEQLSGFADAGFQELELMLYPGHLWPRDMAAGERGALRGDLESLGLSVRTLNQPNIDVNVAAANPQMRRHSLDIQLSAIRLAAEIGAEGLVIGPGKPNPLLPAPLEQLTGWCFAALDEMLPVADSCGVQLLMENMPFAFLPDADSMMSALERYGADQIGVVYDIANAHFIGEDLGDGLARVASRLHTVHVSDTTRSVYRHDPVGAGDLDFSQALGAIEAVEHARLPVLEIISADPARDIPRSVRLLCELGWAGPGG
jgi:sugar phosphate isomerase/epimerase